MAGKTTWPNLTRSQDMVYYTYFYLDPRRSGRYCYDDLGVCFLFRPFYVGKGKNGRALQHLVEAMKFSEGKASTISPAFARTILKIVSTLDRDPYVVVMGANSVEQKALDFEQLSIEVIGRAYLGEGPLLNIHSGGVGGTTYEWTEEHKKNHMERLKLNNPMHDPAVAELNAQMRLGVKRTEEQCERIRNSREYGPQTPESNRKRSEALTGRTMSPEAVAKSVQTRRTEGVFDSDNFIGEKNPFYGRQHSEESRDLMRKNCSMYRPEVVEKMKATKAANKAAGKKRKPAPSRPQTPETREKIRLALVGKKRSPAATAKMHETLARKKAVKQDQKN